MAGYNCVAITSPVRARVHLHRLRDTVAHKTIGEVALRPGGDNTTRIDGYRTDGFVPARLAVACGQRPTPRAYGDSAQSPQNCRAAYCTHWARNTRDRAQRRSVEDDRRLRLLPGAGIIQNDTRSSAR
jgi:hypothetical protein